MLEEKFFNGCLLPVKIVYGNWDIWKGYEKRVCPIPIAVL